MKKSPELNELNSRLLEIINECKSDEGTNKLQTIYDTLNENNALQVVGLKQKVIYFLRNLSPSYRNEILQKKIAEARNDALNVIKEYIFTEDIMKKSIGMIKDVPSDLASSIYHLADVSLGVKFRENTVKRYPIELTDKIKKQVHYNGILEMSKAYLDNHISVPKIIEVSKKTFKQRAKEIEDKSRDFEIEPYYGTKEFMQSRITYIKDCMEKMLLSKRFEGREDIQTYIERINKIIYVYENMSLNINSVDKQKSRYSNLETLYKETLEMEEALFPEVAQVWEEKLSSVEEYSKDGNFAFLAYQMTEGVTYPKGKAKISTKYITQNTLALDGDYGLIYSPNSDNLLTMCSGDAENWVITKEDFINSRIFKAISVYRVN